MEKTPQCYSVLEILAHRKVADAYEVATDAQLKIGEIHTILLQLEEGGKVESRRSAKDGSSRLFYRLTVDGVELLHEYQDEFGPTVKLGLLSQVKNELLTAIDQVWSGFFNVGVRREKERQGQSPTS